MKTYKTRTFEEKYTDTITCDICKKTYCYRKDEMNINKDDCMEIQEFHHIGFRGGYGSIFGDGNDVTCDICQHCLKSVLGKYLVVEGSEECPWNG